MNFQRPHRTPNANRRTPTWLFALLACSAITCCSCTTMKSVARTEDFSEEVQRARKDRLAKVAMNSTEESPGVMCGYEQLVYPSNEGPGVMRLGGQPRSDIQQVAYQEPYCPPDAAANCPPGAIMTCPPQPRMPVAGPNPYAVGMPQVEMASVPSPQLHPDEYLCDGGDRQLPVHYDANQRQGLDTEDTVAEYVDHRGVERMNPSSKVCVYAPRFAAVRTVSQPVLGDYLNKSVGMINATVDDELRTRIAGTQGVKRDALGGIRIRSRASGMESEEIGAGFAQDVAAVQHDKINNLFENFNFTQFVKIDQLSAARLNYGLRAALAWSREASPIISAKVEVPTEGLMELSATTLTVIDDKPSDVPGVLQLAKFADKKDAQPGDVITFTIRYRNAGEREVHYVRIVDNLTPRLEFVDESVTSDRDGRLAVEDNGEGSLVLTFELSESLPADTGGVITFQTRVR